MKQVVMPPRIPEQIETLRMSDQQKKDLVDRKPNPLHTAPVTNRRQARVVFDAKNTTITITQAASDARTYSVLPRNLSAKGIGFVIGQFIYPDSITRVSLPSLDGEMHGVMGKVVRCTHYEGIAHDCSIVFDEPIDLLNFVKSVPEPVEQDSVETNDDARAVIAMADEIATQINAGLRESERFTQCIDELVDTLQKLKSTDT